MHIICCHRAQQQDYNSCVTAAVDTQQSRKDRAEQRELDPKKCGGSVVVSFAGLGASEKYIAHKSYITSNTGMPRLLLLVLSLCCSARSFVRQQGWRVDSRSAALSAIQNAPYEDIIPFLSEHVQPSDQLLFVGARTDLCVQLAKNGYGG